MSQGSSSNTHHERGAPPTTRAAPWFARSRLFNPALMNASLLAQLQAHFRFIDGELIYLQAKDQVLSLTRHDNLKEKSVREAFSIAIRSNEPDILVFFLPRVFEHMAPDGIDPRKKGIMRFSIGLSEDNFSWLMGEVEIHPLFIEALHSRVGQFAVHETLDSDTREPSQLHIIVKVPPAGHLEAAFYIRFSYDTKRMTVLVAGNDLDPIFEQLAEHLQLSQTPYDPFAIAFVFIRRYYYFLEAQGIQVDHAVVMTERETGRGAVAYSDGRATHTISPDKFDLTFMHWVEGNQRNIIFASQFQSKLTAFLISEHMVHAQSTSSGKSSTSSVAPSAVRAYHHLSPQSQALHVRFKAHQTAIDGLHAASLVMRERIQRQLSAADSIVNQYDNKVGLSNAEANIAIAEQSRRIADESRAIAVETRDSTSMKTIASLTMVYLPSTFAASIFSTGFFTFTPGDADGVKVDRQIWMLFVLATTLSFLTVGTWIWLNKHGIPKQLSWARQRRQQPSLRGDSVSNAAATTGADYQTKVPPQSVPGSRPPVQVVSNPRINLPAGPGDDLA